MNIIRDITNVNCSAGNNPKFIIIHDTGNSDKGADALRHAILFKNPNLKNKVSYHVVVDDTRAIQCVEYSNKAYHAGKKYGVASMSEANNSNSIGISMCVNVDCDIKKSYENLIDVTKQIMNQFNIPINRVIRHYDACKKECPAWILNNKLWDDFRNRLVKNNINGDDDMISNSVKIFASCKSENMIQEIKLLQKVTGLTQDGIATEMLVKKLPELTGVESKGVVTVMQRILQLKGYAKDIDTGIIGPACKSAIEKFKQAQGIPLNTKLIDKQTWRKLLEY